MQIIRKQFLLFAFLIYSTIFLGGCSFSNAKKSVHWQDSRKIFTNRAQLEVGDILITPKYWHQPISWHGHSAVILDQETVAEYPKLGLNYQQSSLFAWLSSRTEVAVLRYRNIGNIFRKALLKNLRNMTHQLYGLTLDKKNQNVFYCSSFIWYAYYKTALDLGHNLDIDSNGGSWVMPYDILYSEQLKPIAF